MEANSANESCNVKSVYGYVEVSWEINNFLLASREKNCIITSPEFCIEGPCLTKWQLSLKSEYINEIYTVWNRLERLTCESIEPVLVNWMFCYPYGNGNQYMLQEKTKFEVKSSIERKIDNINELERRLESTDNNTFVVKCSMFVYLAENERIHSKPTDKGLKSLSEDLNILYNVCKGFDTEIKIGYRESLSVHKAIVCSRNAVLKNFIENQGKTVRLDFPNINKDIIKSLIQYFYTGDLKYILRNPSFGMMKTIGYLNENVLKPYFIPDELNLQTKFDTSEFTFLWTVDVSNLKNQEPVLSPKLSFDNVNFHIVLNPYVVGGEVEFSSIYLQTQAGSWSRGLRLQFGVMNIFEQCRSLKTFVWSPASSKEVGFEYFLAGDVLKDDTCVLSGEIKIFCKIQIATGVTNHKVVRNEISPPTLIEKDKHYERLSRQIASLLKTGDYSDFTVGSDALRIRAHRSIICCRSNALKNMIKNQGHVVSVILPCADSNIICKILYYLYSGKVNDEYSTSDVLSIYSKAETWAIYPLKYICSGVLDRKMRVVNVCKILFSAHKFKDQRLKLSAYKFICSNLKEIETQSSWTLIEEAPAILQEFNRFKKSYLNTALHEDKSEMEPCY